MSQKIAEKISTAVVPANASNGWERILSRFIAALLIFAALSKGYELWRVPSAWSAWQVGSELALAIWLIRGVQLRLAMRIATGVFLIYSLVTLWKIYQGEGSCGCFGPITVPPELTFMVDAAIVLMLILAMSFQITRKSIIAIAFVGGSAIALQFTWQHGAVIVAAMIPPSVPALATSPATTSSTTQPAKRFDAVAKQDSPTQWTADLGQTPEGQVVHILFPLTNPSDHALTIRGVNVSCGCTSIPRPPQTIAIDGKTDVEVIVRILDHPGPWDSTVSLTTDGPTLPPLLLLTKGRVP